MTRLHERADTVTTERQRSGASKPSVLSTGREGKLAFLLCTTDPSTLPSYMAATVPIGPVKRSDQCFTL